jgi:hypothetical protein
MSRLGRTSAQQSYKVSSFYTVLPGVSQEQIYATMYVLELELQTAGLAVFDSLYR